MHQLSTLARRTSELLYRRSLPTLLNLNSGITNTTHQQQARTLTLLNKNHCYQQPQGLATLRQTRNIMSGQVPQIGQPAPAFKTMALVDGKFKEVSLEEHLGKYVVLFFYPADFTFVCPTEIIAYSDKIDEFKKLGVEVLGVSTDSHFVHLAWTNVSRKDGGIGKIDYPLLGDKSGKISTSYGVLTPSGLPLRGLFIIDPKGVLRQITINDFPVGRSVDETLRLIQAFQFVEKHGEVCPANWKPGSLTIKPDTEKSKEYFQKAN